MSLSNDNNTATPWIANLSNSYPGEYGGITGATGISDNINHTVIDPINGKVDVWGLCKNTDGDQTLLAVETNDNHLYYADALSNSILFPSTGTGTNLISSTTIPILITSQSPVTLTSGTNSIILGTGGSNNTLSFGAGGITGSVQGFNLINSAAANSLTMNIEGTTISNNYGTTYLSSCNVLGGSASLTVDRTSNTAIKNQVNVGENYSQLLTSDGTYTTTTTQIPQNWNVTIPASNSATGGVSFILDNTSGTPNANLIVGNTGGNNSSYIGLGSNSFTLGATYNGGARNFYQSDGFYYMSGLPVANPGAVVTIDQATNQLFLGSQTSAALVGDGVHILQSGGYGQLNFQGLSSPDSSVAITTGASGNVELTVNSVPQYEGTQVSIGYQAGQSGAAGYSVAIGATSAVLNQAEYCVAVGPNSGNNNQGTTSVAVGLNSGYQDQTSSSVAVGPYCGQYNQGGGCVAVGNNAQQYNSQTYAISIGYSAGQYSAQNGSIQIGNQSGSTGAGGSSVSIGNFSGQYNPGEYAVNIGYQAGLSSVGVDSICIGQAAGFTGCGGNNIAIGTNCLYQNATSSGIVALGYQVGQNGSVGGNSVLLGSQCGNNGCGINCICIGQSAGYYPCGNENIAIGNAALYANATGTGIIAMGYQSGYSNCSGSNCNLIGSQAGYTGCTASNVNVLNASGAALNPPNSGLFVAPISTSSSLLPTVMYNSTTKEIVTSTTKTFVIDHPTDKDKYLVHGCAEGPESSVFYRGTASFDADAIFCNVRLPDYVQHIAKDFTIHLTKIFDDSDWHSYSSSKSKSKSKRSLLCNIYPGKVKDGAFFVYRTLSGSPCEFYWLVYGSRQDIVVEPNRCDVQLHGSGPYKYLSTHLSNI